ncbi:MAG: hypothetical protein CTY18_04100 [Methylomonas sp.]|nr:MAG: hypothetical protein CTY24_06615 [Methylobacter sp.]PPD36561.1 MAG: hypothetical protein CTY18_04100 [Methylomonas sp.]
MASIPPLLLTPVQPVSRLSNLLKVGQQLNSQVIVATVQAEKTAITLKLNGQLVSVQASRPLSLTPGQTLSVEVSRLTPVLTLTLLNPPPTATGTNPNQPPVAVTLTASDESEKPSHANVRLPGLGLAARQQLPATVVSINPQTIHLEITHANAQGASTRTLLEIDHSQLKSLPRNLTAGASVTLETLEAGHDTAFNILPKTAEFTRASLHTLVKQLLPQHQSSEVLLNQLNASLTQLETSENLPQTLKALAQTILQEVPEAPPQDPHTLKTSVTDSGLFLETKLAHKQAVPELNLASDFKAKLLKLNEALQHALIDETNLSPQEQAVVKDLQQKTEHTLAKIVLDQLASLPKEDGSKPVLHLEIPFLLQGQTQTIELKIDYELPQQQQDEQNDDPQARDWTVKLNLNPPGLGNISCAVVCWNRQVSTYFLSQDKHTTALLNEHLDSLKHQLENAGLAVGQIIAHNQPTGNLPEALIKPDSNLFNDKA